MRIDHNNDRKPSCSCNYCRKHRPIPVCRELAYITNTGTQSSPGNTVTVIDTETDQVIDTITVGTLPLGIGITPNGRRVYVANQLDRTVSVINTAENVVINTIPLDNYPISLVITPDGTRAYVTLSNGEDTVAVIDIETNTVTETIPVGRVPLGQAIGNTPFGTRDYVANFEDDTVSVINVNPDSPPYNTVIFTIPVEDGPEDVVMTPDGTTVYVTNYNANSVSAIDTGTNAVTTIPVGIGPVGAGIGNTPFGVRAYITHETSQDIYIIDADPTSPAFNTVVDIIKKDVTGQPSDAAFTADGLKAYVPTYNGNTVLVIDTSKDEVIRTIKAGDFPNIITIGRVCGFPHHC
ncbi:YncE family protein [Halobacillus massiliensis]|uniref:YncE family protein n=1 Tax=Halobacillus massiliensis TaxID=1926286 RepID=UPI0015C45026|nr:YncE family protein [Halobacillus massiliensis]